MLSFMYCRTTTTNRMDKIHNQLDKSEYFLIIVLIWTLDSVCLSVKSYLRCFQLAQPRVHRQILWLVLVIAAHSHLFSLESGRLSAAQCDRAANWCWLLVYADVKVRATVQTGHDLPSSTNSRLVFTLIHSNCSSCIEVKYYYHPLLHCDPATIPPLTQPTNITAPAGSQAGDKLVCFLDWNQHVDLTQTQHVLTENPWNGHICCATN